MTFVLLWEIISFWCNQVHTFCKTYATAGASGCKCPLAGGCLQGRILTGQIQICIETCQIFKKALKLKTVKILKEVQPQCLTNYNKSEVV